MSDDQKPDDWYVAMCAQLHPRWRSCIDALYTLTQTDPECYANTVSKIADATHHTRAHVRSFFTGLRHLRQNKNE